MERRIEILIGAIALIAVVCCLLVAEGQPGSGWGALPGDRDAQAAPGTR